MEYQDNWMEKYDISEEEWNEMSDREKLIFKYNIEVGNKVTISMFKAISFIKQVDISIIPKEEKDQILKKMEKAKMAFDFPIARK